MNTNIPSEAAEAKNKLEAGIWFHRLDIVLTDDTELYFCNNTVNTVINGTEYIRLPFIIGDDDQTSGGAVPTREIQIGNVDIARILVPYIKDYNGMRGAKITITKVFCNEPDIDMSALSQTYTVLNSIPAEDWVVIRLGSANLLRQNIPLDKYRHTICRFAKNFKGAECGYVGAETTCDGKLGTCISYGNEERWGAEINLKPKTIRWV